MQKEGTDAAIEYLESRRPSTLETARRHAEQAKTAQARTDGEKELRNKSLQALVLEAELLETKLQWKPALQLREQVAELAPDWLKARNSLGNLQFTLARFPAAEPHLRAAVKLAATAGDEAIALNNLAVLLKATNRLAEAEPLMRRCVAIGHQFGRKTGHEHPNTRTFEANYRGILQALKLPEEEIVQRVKEATAITGRLKPIAAHLDERLGPLPTKEKE